MTGTGHDLRQLFKAVGTVGSTSGGLGALERTDATEHVEVLDEPVLKIDCDPLDVLGFTDGIQNAIHLMHRDARPVVLYYVAAGCISAANGSKITPVALRERLRILAAEPDHEWIDTLGTTIPIETLTGDTPPDMELEVTKVISDNRARLETQLLDELLAGDDPRPVVVDGSLLAKRNDDRLVAVTKSARTRYLPDERLLFTLRAGWRSPRFTVSRGGAKRWSCYLQLADKHNGPWNLGLVRLEAFDRDLLEPLASLCLTERQGPRSGDARWDRHLASVRAVEDFLRAKRPVAFR